MSNALSVRIEFPRSGQLRFLQLPKELSEVKGVCILETPLKNSGSDFAPSSEKSIKGEFSPRRSE